MCTANIFFFFLRVPRLSVYFCYSQTTIRFRFSPSFILASNNRKNSDGFARSTNHISLIYNHNIAKFFLLYLKLIFIPGILHSHLHLTLALLQETVLKHSAITFHNTNPCPYLSSKESLAIV